MATTLGSKSVGSTIKLKENGIWATFYVARQDYEAGLNGSGRVLVVRSACYGAARTWGGTNAYASSTVDSWLNGTYKNMLDAGVRSAMGTTKFYYTPGNGNTTLSTLGRSIFLLSASELGLSGSSLKSEGSMLSKDVLDLLKDSSTQWTRSPYNISGSNAHIAVLDSDGRLNYYSGDRNWGVRPAFTLPASAEVNSDNTVTINTAPSVPAGIMVPASINGGDTVTLTWTASSDSEGNLEGYKVERSTDGGSTWTQIYQGGARTTTNTVAFGTASVMYRVRAYDSEGLHSGYRTSASVTVINNLAPTAPASVSVPLNVFGGKPLTVSWTTAADPDGNLSGYALERQDNGGEWVEIYRGPALTYTDSVPKGLQTVAYRVRAYDDLEAAGPYAVSEARTVNNNTAPAIACEETDLGERSEGFAVPYSVTDEDGDDITITEAVGSTTLRTFQAEDGAENTLSLTGEDFMRVLNGEHTVSITASDGKEQSVHKLTFRKSVTEASVTLAEPLPADAPITVCALSVSGSIPADADFSVKVTNNALADVPVWEDCTAAVRNGANVVFTHQADSGHGFNFRLHVKRGPSGQGGYITSIQGGFQ